MTWNVIVTLSLGRNVPILIVTVSPDIVGTTAVAAGALFNVAGFVAACGARGVVATGVARNRLVDVGA